MGKLDNCDNIYSADSIERDIQKSIKYQQTDSYSIAFSLSAISKTLYNIMMMKHMEGNK